jgi:hypothetical protein
MLPKSVQWSARCSMRTDRRTNRYGEANGHFPQVICKRTQRLADGDILLIVCVCVCVFPHGTTARGGPGSADCRGFPIPLRPTSVGRTPLDEWSVRRRDLYLTIHKTHNRQTSMSPSAFELTVPISERPQTQVLDRMAAGIGVFVYITEWNECAVRCGSVWSGTAIKEGCHAAKHRCRTW